MRGISTVIGQEHFILYCLGLLIIAFLSPIAWLKSDKKRTQTSRLLVLISLIIISSFSINTIFCYLFHLQLISIILWYRNWKDFLWGSWLLNIIFILSSFINPFAALDMVKVGFPVLINFALAYFLYYYSQNLKKLSQLSKIFRIMLNTTNNGIQFIDKKVRPK